MPRLYFLAFLPLAPPLNAQTASQQLAPQPAAQTAPATPPQTSAAPQAAPSQDEPITTIKVQVNEVNLVFTVTDKKGRFITGLKRENFGLLDDQRPPVAP